MFDIEWSKRSRKQLLGLPVDDRRRVYDAVQGLRGWPDCGQVKALQGAPGYRLRVGRYRVIFDVATTLRIVRVEEVKKRDERTYHPHRH